MPKILQAALTGSTVLGMLIPSAVYGVDHNNLDAGRPLSFDDAESIGRGEQSLELGAALVVPSDEAVGGEFDVEYLYGFALNTHVILGIDPQVGGRADPGDTNFDPGDLSLGVLHNFNREFDAVPAFALRLDAAFPTGRDSDGVNFRLRGIASKTLGQSNRLHLNLDLELSTASDEGDRSVIPGAILGYSRPLGIPRRFDRTFLAEIGLRAGEEADGAAVFSLGVGLRQQIGKRSIFDLGVQSNLTGSNEERNDFRLVTGYSLSF
ncbi:MAG: transporter [Chloroflexaceae bacterium]|nr:transporter [Chloroflexaceae bacterium]